MKYIVKYVYHSDVDEIIINTLYFYNTLDEAFNKRNELIDEVKTRFTKDLENENNHLKLTGSEPLKYEDSVFSSYNFFTNKHIFWETFGFYRHVMIQIDNEEDI